MSGHVIGWGDGGLPHAVPAAPFTEALRAARSTEDFAKAYRPDSVCEVRVVVDRDRPWTPWRPGENACPDCVKALTP